MHSNRSFHDLSIQQQRTDPKSLTESSEGVIPAPHDLPAKNGLYDPRFEHDACGIGFVAHSEGRKSHRIVQMALQALARHSHRGALADDHKTGDGAGILTHILLHGNWVIATG